MVEKLYEKKPQFFKFFTFLNIFRGLLLSQFSSYNFQNCYLAVNLRIEQVLFFMFIKNIDSFADIHTNSIFHGGHLGFFQPF